MTTIHVNNVFAYTIELKKKVTVLSQFRRFLDEIPRLSCFTEEYFNIRIIPIKIVLNQTVVWVYVFGNNYQRQKHNVAIARIESLAK